MRLILEAGNCRNDIGWALDAVDAAAQTGAWAFKVQMFRPETLTSRGAPTYGKGLGEPATQWENFAGALEYDAWEPVIERCVERDIQFLATPFDGEAVDWLAAHDVGWFKIASADITFPALIRAAAATGGRIIMSTGGSTRPEVSRAVGWIAQTGTDPAEKVALLACTLSYPTEPADAHMARMDTLRTLGTRWVGYSDHTPGPDGIATARAYGADFCEKHFTITPGVGGDHDFAVTPDQVNAGTVRPEMYGDGFLVANDSEHQALALARRSWHATRTIEPGERIRPEDVIAVRPATGIAPYEPIVGLKADVRIERGDPITWPMLT